MLEVSTALLSDSEIRAMSILTTIKKAPISFDRFPVGAVLQEPMGRRRHMRYMKITMNNQSFWAPFVPTLKGTYTNKEMHGLVDDDWEVWL